MAKKRWTVDDIPDQTARTVLVTGANSGLGLRSAEALARAGAEVLMACRDQARATVALDAVKAAATGAEPRVVALDLADLSSVRSCAEEVAASVDRLDVLMNNAGVMALPLRRTVDGFEMQFGTNHLGHFALTGQLLGPLTAAGDGARVVTTTSFVHWGGRMRWTDLNWEGSYHKWMAYGQSKLANLLFMFELDRRARAAGSSLTAAAAHPGYAATHLQAAGPEMTGNRLMEKAVGLGNRLVAQSDAQGALPQLYAATAPGVGGGEVYGPDGPVQTRGYPRRVGVSRAARSATDAARLWRTSEELTGVTYDWR